MVSCWQITLLPRDSDLYVVCMFMFDIPDSDGGVRWCVMGWCEGPALREEWSWFSREEDATGTTWRLRLRLSTRTGGTMVNTGGWTGSSCSSEQVRTLQSQDNSRTGDSDPLLWPAANQQNFQLWISLSLSLWSRLHPVIVFDVHRCAGLYERKIKKILSIFLLFCKCNNM